MIELLMHDDPGKIGHLFCTDCVTEINVNLELGDTVYKNPNLLPSWNVEWHEFYNVRFIYLELLIDLHRDNQIKRLHCPKCDIAGDIIVMDNGLFDIQLIHKSLNIDDIPPYGFKCAVCEEVYATSRCVTRIGSELVCGDCVVAKT